MDLYNLLKERFVKIAAPMMGETIQVISARTLSPEEAIGKPERKDYPILKGKEVMIEATFRGAGGQAFTDMPGNFQGSLRNLIDLNLDDNFERAVFIAGFNAVMRYYGYISNTVHCKDDGPKRCAEQLPAFIAERFGKPKIAFIGYQPAMIQALSSLFSLRVIDLDKDNIGARRFGIGIESPDKTEVALLWADMIVATGSTSVNNTISSFLDNKPVIFYGVTIAGIAALQDYKRYCPHSG